MFRNTGVTTARKSYLCIVIVSMFYLTIIVKVHEVVILLIVRCRQFVFAFLRYYLLSTTSF